MSGLNTQGKAQKKRNERIPERYTEVNQMNADGNRLKAYLGDITRLKVDAIVNAANRTLLGGGGVDGAIHRAAGPELLKECAALGGCQTGQAKITKGYRLPAKFVIHTVGPVWYGGRNDEEEFLAMCYRNSLKIAAVNSINSIAFPSISTGVYSFPFEKAADIAVTTVLEYLSVSEVPWQVIFCCFSEKDYWYYIKQPEITEWLNSSEDEV